MGLVLFNDQIALLRHMYQEEMRELEVDYQLFVEKEMATHSSTLAWKIPWMEKPHRLQSMGSQRVRHDWALWVASSIKVCWWQTSISPECWTHDISIALALSVWQKEKHSTDQHRKCHRMHQYSSVARCTQSFRINRRPCPIGGVPSGTVIMNPPANAGDTREAGSIPELGRFPGIGHGNPLQYSCLGNPMDRGICWATVHRVIKHQTGLCG